jgi:hypothetical protein
MTRPDFDPKRPATWPAVLTIDEVAAIYGRSRDAIRHSLKPSRGRVAFQPAPFKRSPAQWRRSDVVRDLRVQQEVTA